MAASVLALITYAVPLTKAIEPVEGESSLRISREGLQRDELARDAELRKLETLLSNAAAGERVRELIRFIRMCESNDVALVAIRAAIREGGDASLLIPLLRMRMPAWSAAGQTSVLDAIKQILPTSDHAYSEFVLDLLQNPLALKDGGGLELEMSPTDVATTIILRAGSENAITWLKSHTLADDLTYWQWRGVAGSGLAAMPELRLRAEQVLNDVKQSTANRVAAACVIANESSAAKKYICEAIQKITKDHSVDGSRAGVSGTDVYNNQTTSLKDYNRQFNDYYSMAGLLCLPDLDLQRLLRQLIVSEDDRLQEIAGLAAVLKKPEMLEEFAPRFSTDRLARLIALHLTLTNGGPRSMRFQDGDSVKVREYVSFIKSDGAEALFPFTAPILMW